MPNAVTPASASACTSSPSTSGNTQPISTCPGCMRPTSAAAIRPTRTTMSAPAYTSSPVATRAPTSRYPSSGSDAGSPAPAPTSTSRPPSASRFAVSGVSATRCSPGAVSRGTPMRMRRDPTEPGRGPARRCVLRHRPRAARYRSAPVPPPLYDRLRDLPLRVDGCRFEDRSVTVGAGWERHTTLVRLHGGGEEGVGEDVTYEVDDQLAHQAAGPPAGLAGEEHTLDGFSRLLDALEPLGPPVTRPPSHDYRRWAFESAALDLALRQSGQT